MTAPAREVGLIALLYVGYTASRLLGGSDATAAARRGLHIEAIERSVHLDPEPAANAWAASHEVVEVLTSYWYSTMHYVVTGAVLIWLWLRHQEGYRRARNVLVVVTLAALAVYITMPVAPPRLLDGFHDTLAATSWAGWWSAHASAPRGFGGATNELAAMPSMHVGWAVWVAVMVVRNTHGRFRHLAWLYPVTTTVVVICSANHWLLDTVAGGLLVMVVVALESAVQRARRPATVQVAAPVLSPVPAPLTSNPRTTRPG